MDFFTRCSFEEDVRDTMNGKYGNGQERKDRLGNNYGAIQNEINRRTGSNVRHPDYGYSSGPYFVYL